MPEDDPFTAFTLAQNTSDVSALLAFSFSAYTWYICVFAQVASDLYQGLYRFFETQPHLQQRPLFITGESYAGKYVPSIGDRT